MRFVITAGGTREYIDPVRFLSNASTGRMGYALAQAATKAGHDVILISAVTNLKVPAGVELVNVVTSQEMYKAVRENFSDCDCLIMAAAVSDYKPAKMLRTKMKKKAESLLLELKPTRDILKWAGKNKRRGQVVVGFALEDKNLIANAEAKMESKRADMIVANAPAAIGAEKSTVLLRTHSQGWEKIENKSKAIIARKIITKASTLADQAASF